MRVSEPDKIDEAIFNYHKHLAEAIWEKVKEPRPKRIVEIGPGPGTFTIPFVETIGLDFERFYCVDSYRRHYYDSRKKLEEVLEQKGLDKKMDLITKDAEELHLVAERMDLVVGHEVLCTLTPEKIEGVMKSALDTLVRGGKFVHAELSPHAQNKGEELFITMDKEYSIEPTSEAGWFSPTADMLAGLAHKVGYRSIDVEYLKIPIRFTGDAGAEILKRLGIEEDFLRIHIEEIHSIGLEYPMEQIIYLRK